MTEPNIHRIRSGVIAEAYVSDAITRELGARPTRLIKHETQAPRFVWEAAFDDRDAVIFKAEQNAGDDAALALEAWTIEQVRPLGVPAPRVLAFDAGESMFPGWYLILEKIGGLPLPPVWRPREPDEANLSPEQMRRALQQAGGQLRAIHSISVSGYGRLDDVRYLRTGDVHGRFDSWADAVLGPALGALTYLETRGAVSTDDTNPIRRAIHRHGDILQDCSDPRLLHGDLGAKHIFVDPRTGDLTGIIDFGDRESGDPAMDLANFQIWEDAGRLESLLEGYGHVTGDLRVRIAMCALADSLRLAHKRYMQGRVDAAEPVVEDLLRIVEQVRRL